MGDIGPIAGGNTALHGVKAYNSIAQSIGSGATAALLLDSEEFDTDGYHSTSVNTSRITIPVGMDGYYQLTGHCHVPYQYDAALWFKVGGSTSVVGSGFGHGIGISAGTNSFDGVASAVVYLAAGQYVEFWGYSDGAAENFGHANADLHTTVTAIRIGV